MIGSLGLLFPVLHVALRRVWFWLALGALLSGAPLKLIGLDWVQEAGYRVAPLAVGSGRAVGFTLLDPAAVGIDFTNTLSPQRMQMFQNLMNGSGLAAADVDGDGRIDLFFCHKQAANQLYRNLGNGRFTNITSFASVACTNQTSVGAVFGDLNGDGAPDLVVSSFGGPNAVLINDGKGHFTDQTAASGIAGKSGYTSIALSDIDGDGDLDLYLCNFGIQSILRDGGVISTRMVNGQPQVTGRNAQRVRIIDGLITEFGEPDTLFLNDGHAHFTPVPWEQAFQDAAGKSMSPPWDFGLAVQIRDANGDGFPDIYVCNDFQTPDRLWLGDGRGHFREAPLEALRNMSYASMGVDFADLDRNGRYDFITVEMLSENLPQHLRTSSPMQSVKRIPGEFMAREDLTRNCLYWNRGDGTWAEIATFAGVAATSWSWTPLFLDVDLDGWEDLLISNGHLHDVNNRDITDQSRPKPGQSLQATKDRLPQFPHLDPPKFAFRNRHDLTFEDQSHTWGFDSTRIAHGMIAADLDDDGDLDVILNALDGPPLLYRNNATAPRVAVRVKGLAPNTAGIGAQLILIGGPVDQRQEVVAGGQYLSHSDTQRTFAAGTNLMQLEVRWRSGKRSVIRNVQANHVYEVAEAGAEVPPSSPPASTPAPWFVDVSDRLHFQHSEPAHDDFAIQPTLPQRYSQLGPGVAWFDFNGDGHVDLFIGTGRGGRPGGFWGDGKGGFIPATTLGTTASDDFTGLAAWVDSNGRPNLLSGVANYEMGTAMPEAAVIGWSAQGPSLSPVNLIPGSRSSPGPLAVGDCDGDGDLDLFVGSRLTVGSWPAPGGSRFFRNDGGTLVAEDPGVFAGIGPVSDALFADLDGDGRPELVLAEELGPIRIFKRVAGTWSELTKAWGLANMTGWWNSVAVGDFDEDGRLDLLVGNRGLNSFWQIWSQGQPRILWNQSDTNSPVTVIEAGANDGALLPIRDRNTLSTALPDLTSRFPTHAAYAAAGARNILGANPGPIHEVQVNTLASVVLLNRGDHFETRPLPREAQWSPIFGLAVADFDADGHTDVALAQNLFAVRPDDSRLDAGRGLVLRGDGYGNFTPLSSRESGVIVDGEQRGAAADDFDEDGRTDLVITQNGAAATLWHNVGTRPGWRVRLIGPSGNPDGLGAVVTVRRNEKSAIAHAVTAGGGYWSQAGTVLVVSGEGGSELSVRWPDRRVNRVTLPPKPSTLSIKWSDAAAAQ